MIAEKINTWHTEIDLLTKEFRSEFGHLSAAQLNWKPNAGTWSIAQNIDHLITINETYYPVVENIRNGSLKLPVLAKWNFITNLFGKLILKSVTPDRKKKIKTFPIWEPATSEISADVVDRFAQHQERLKELIGNSQDLLEKNTVIASPANMKILYKLSAAFDIIVTHERRHLEQARELLKMMK